MRAEDKRIGPDHDPAKVGYAERNEAARFGENKLEHEDDLPTADRDAEAAKAARSGRLLGVMAELMRGRREALSDMGDVTPTEREALRFLDKAITGYDAETRIVFAEDRRELLEQALAVLYPMVAHAREQSASVLEPLHDAVVGRIEALRTQLSNLEDSEMDPIELRQRSTGDGGGEGDEDDEDDEDDADAAAAKRPPEAEIDPDAPGSVGDPGMMP